VTSRVMVPIRRVGLNDPMDLTKALHDAMSLCATLDMRAVQWSAEVVELELDWDESRLTTGGGMHGGALMALADSAGAVVAFSNLPEGAVGTSTIESKTNFFRAVRSGTVRAVSTPLHIGRTTIVVDTELRDDAGKLVARVTQTQIVLMPS